MIEVVNISVEQLKGIIAETFQQQMQTKEKGNSQEEEKDEFLTFSEVLRLLKITGPTLYKRMNDNTIPYFRLGKRLLFPKNKIIEVLVTGENLVKTIDQTGIKSIPIKE